MVDVPDAQPEASGLALEQLPVVLVQLLLQPVPRNLEDKRLSAILFVPNFVLVLPHSIALLYSNTFLP